MSHFYQRQFGGDAVGLFRVRPSYRTRSAGSSGAHFPEIVLGPKRQNTFGWQVLQPELFRLVVYRCSFISSKVGGVESRWIQLELFGQALPSHVDGSFFEVITKGPVSQHFKESVVVYVFSDII